MKIRKLSMFSFILFLGVLHLLCASLSFAAPIESLWNMGLTGVSSQDTDTASQFVGFGLNSKTKYSLNSDLVLNFEALLKFENGHFQSLDGQRKNESGLTLREAGAHAFTTSPLSFSAGALNTSTNHSALLMGGAAFPALRAQLKIFELHDTQSRLDLQQAIPTSSSLSSDSEDAQALPQFLSASLSLNHQSSAYYWKNRLGVFRFDHLPRAVAKLSEARGNTVLPVTEQESTFAYEYAGMDAESSLRVPVMRGWDFLAGGAYLQNTKAPKNSNRAYSMTAGSEFYFVGQKSLEIALTGFRIESDAAVAAFNSAKYFFTNRQGYSFESYLNFRKSQFRVGFSYSEADLIYLNPFQNREKSLMLLLETFYAKI